MTERGPRTVGSVLEVVPLEVRVGAARRSEAAAAAVRQALVRWAAARWDGVSFAPGDFELAHDDSGALELVTYRGRDGGGAITAAMGELKISASHSRGSACGLVTWEENGDG